ncbi:flocculation protein FLO11-like [Chrysoperla carnea]|uniref:flocculation protein FLO11-like n=1 Tax=Chrysoperla carnea TaxID=189513 RepID=UPI001D06BCC2|nr:flocculation protein FLO11-like [Chrysoperla carnea]
MSPLNLVGMLFLLLTPSIQSYRTDFGPDDSLNTISSTPFPSFGQSSSYSGSKSFASSFASSGSYSASHSSSGGYSSGIPAVTVNDFGASGIKSGTYSGAGAGAFSGSASGVNPNLFGLPGSKVAENVNAGLGNPFGGAASYSSSGSFSSGGSASGSNSFSSTTNAHIGGNGQIAGSLGNEYVSGVKNIASGANGGGFSGAGSYSSSGLSGSGVSSNGAESVGKLTGNLGTSYNSGIKGNSAFGAGYSGGNSGAFSTNVGSSGSYNGQASVNSGDQVKGNLGGAYTTSYNSGVKGNSAFGAGYSGGNSGAFSTSGSSLGSGSSQYNGQASINSADQVKGNLGGAYGSTTNGVFVSNGVSGINSGNYNKPIKGTGGKVQFVQSTASTVNIKNNPFLTGQVRPVAPGDVPKPVVIADSSSASSSISGNRASVDISKNPFLTGSVPAPPAKPIGCNNINGGSCSGSTSPPLIVSGGCNGGAASVCGGSKPIGSQSGSGSSLNNNPFLGGNYQPQPSPPKPPQKPADLSGNPFLTGGNKGPSYQPNAPQTPFPQKPSVPQTPYPQQPTPLPQQPQGFPSTVPQNPPVYQSSYPQPVAPTIIPQKPQPFPSTYPQQPQPIPTAIPQGTYTQSGKTNVLIDSSAQSTSIDESGLQCGSSGYICVPKEHCVNGLVSKYGEGLFQVRNSAQYCKQGSEVCCKLDKSSYPTPSFVAPSSPPAVTQFQSASTNYQQSSQFSGNTAGSTSTKYVSNSVNQLPQSTIGSPTFTSPNLGPLLPGPYSTSGIIVEPGVNPFRNVDDIRGPQYLPPVASPSTPPKISTPRPTTTTTTTTTPRPTTQAPTYLPPRVPDSSVIYVKTTQPTTTTTTTQSPNAYLPPYEGDGSEVKNQNILPPYEGNPSDQDQTIVGFPTSPRPVPTQGIILNTAVPSGCAAALKCVPVDFCTAEGVISNTSVRLTPQQNEQRVPLTDCLVAESSNVIGKCCRDPTYKDPWPVGQLGLWNPDNGFDDGQYRPDSQKPQRITNQLGPQNQPRFPPSVSNPFASGSILSPTQVKPSPNFLPQPTCGVRNPNTQPRGNSPIDASFGEIPWQAMVLRDSSRKLICGGIIVGPDAVITAAHCVQGIQANDILVKGGEWRLGIDEEPKPFQIVKVGSVIIHPQYSPDNLFNDVAILKLSEKFRFDKHIDAICLPGADEVIENNYSAGNCIATGWGKQALTINIQNSLMHRIPINLLQPEQCQNTLANNHQNSLYQYSPSTCICGAPKVPQNNLCDVDQGSALACDSGNGHYVLSGIFSWETGCDQGNQVGGFTRLDMQWVLSQLGQSSSNGGAIRNNFASQQQQSIYQQKTNQYFPIKGSYSQNRPQYRPLPISYNGAEPPCNCEG